MGAIYLSRDFALGSEGEVYSQNKGIHIETACSPVNEAEADY